MEGCHQDTPSFCSGIGLRAEADLSSDDGKAQISFREIVVSGDLPICGPPVHPIRMIMEDLLDVADGQMLGGSMYPLDDLVFNLWLISHPP